VTGHSHFIDLRMSADTVTREGRKASYVSLATSALFLLEQWEEEMKMNFGFVSKYKWPIVGFTVAMVSLMIFLAFKSPQPFLSGFMGVLGTVLGASISQFAQWSIFKQEETAKFRLAAVDRRLEVHQKAFTLWRELMWSTNDEKNLSEAIRQCQSFWKNNCLYLDPKSRNSCLNAVNSAALFNMDRDHLPARERTEIMEEIRKAFEDLEKGVGLPAIGDIKDYEEMKPSIKENTT